PALRQKPHRTRIPSWPAFAGCSDSNSLLRSSRSYAERRGTPHRMHRSVRGSWSPNKCRGEYRTAAPVSSLAHLRSADREVPVGAECLASSGDRQIQEVAVLYSRHAISFLLGARVRRCASDETGAARSEEH